VSLSDRGTIAANHFIKRWVYPTLLEPASTSTIPKSTYSIGRS
jgi:hypothetical protein